MPEYISDFSDPELAMVKHCEDEIRRLDGHIERHTRDLLISQGKLNRLCIRKHHLLAELDKWKDALKAAGE